VTGDIGIVDTNTNVMFVYGRKSAIYHNEFKLPIQLDKLERTIKAIPYIGEVIFLKVDQASSLPSGKTPKLILLVYPDINFSEAKRIGLLRLGELMKVYHSKINVELGNSLSIDDIVIVPSSFIKTQDGKICRYFYS
jgi:hypothetical protein